MPFHLIKHEPLAPGLRRIAQEQIGIVLGDFADDTMSLNRKVHSLRARCKKMRGLLRLPRPLMGEAFDTEDQRFRTAAKQLSKHREMAVHAKTIASLGGSDIPLTSADRPIPAASIESSLAIMETGLQAVADWPLPIDTFADIAPGFSRVYGNCLDAWRDVLNEPSDEHFHRLRRMTKYHWYQIRILERFNKDALRPRREKLRQLQLKLGDAHDLFALLAFLESCGNPDPELFERALGRKYELYADSIRTGRDVYATPVGELVDDLSRFWEGWHH